MPRIIITDRKNLAFADQPKPILASELPQHIKTRSALKMLDIEVESQKFINKKIRAGEHHFPPNIEIAAIESLGDKSERFNRPLITEGKIPEHLSFQAAPLPLPDKMKTPVFYRNYISPVEAKRGNEATTVFPPDNRRIFLDTSYPFCTCGRVDSPIGQGSGAMVGPRHLLTCSHIIQWQSDGTAGWVRFRPGYYAPSEPFGDAWATRVYFKYKVTGPTIDWIEGMYDYVVCVLDRPIGNWTGWLGGKGYTDSWDGGDYWCHVGYPGDLTAGNRPTYQDRISLNGAWWQFDSHEAMSHRGDVWPGQSGGPFFGWWDGKPYAVAVQSSHNSNENNASGGQDLVDLILRARREHP